ncbi:MAG: uroporphyrinogen-III synthase [Alphaproteobacteria bacterium]|nr:uroporphyrinogen-III synthase [Alphaproteobacteria bacterium]MBM3625286.1 uroporphyrinogen-III synthase [Alphaproteobacteria bacterium]
MRRVLVLRAADDAARTAQKLRALEFEPILSPVLDIAATGAQIPQEAYDAALASSAKGVELAQSAEAFKVLPLHAVGEKTAQAARALAWRTDIVAGNAEAILPLLLARHPEPAYFLYLAGCDRQPTLEAGLKAAGHRVVAAEVYEARAAKALSKEAIDAIAAGEIDAVLHYSRRSAEIFLSLAKAAGILQKARAALHLALSHAVAKPLLCEDFPNVGVAERPDEAHLMELLARR